MVEEILSKQDNLFKNNLTMAFLSLHLLSVKQPKNLNEVKGEHS